MKYDAFFIGSFFYHFFFKKVVDALIRQFARPNFRHPDPLKYGVHAYLGMPLNKCDKEMGPLHYSLK